MLACRNAEGVHVQRKVGNPWYRIIGVGSFYTTQMMLHTNLVKGCLLMRAKQQCKASAKTLMCSSVRMWTERKITGMQGYRQILLEGIMNTISHEATKLLLSVMKMKHVV